MCTPDGQHQPCRWAATCSKQRDEQRCCSCESCISYNQCKTAGMHPSAMLSTHQGLKSGQFICMLLHEICQFQHELPASLWTTSFLVFRACNGKLK